MGKFVAKRKLRNNYSQKNSQINGLYSKNGLNIARIDGAWRNLVLYNNEYRILNTITKIDELETLLKC